jgi:hypothetical protein
MKWLKRTSIIVLFVVVILWLVKLSSPFIKIDGYQGLLLGLLLETDTKYSNEYTHRGFVNVQEGMEEEDVLDLLGEPLVRWFPMKTKYTAFQYAESTSSTHYRLRQVYFQNGVVVLIRGYFWAD